MLGMVVNEDYSSTKNNREVASAQQAAFKEFLYRMKDESWFNLPPQEQVDFLDNLIVSYELGPLEWIVLSKLFDPHSSLYAVQQ